VLVLNASQTALFAMILKTAQNAISGFSMTKNSNNVCHAQITASPARILRHVFEVLTK